MRRRQVPATTHTVEMAQIAEFNDRLSQQPERTITAGELGMEGVRVGRRGRGGRLPGTAVLERVEWDGAPEFPDIHGHFSASGGPRRRLVVDLHTPALRTLSQRLGLHHVWGVGNV